MLTMSIVVPFEVFSKELSVVMTQSWTIDKHTGDLYPRVLPHLPQVQMYRYPAWCYRSYGTWVKLNA